MGKRSSGFIYFWIFVYQQNIWNEKYIFEWYIFFLTYFIDGKTFVWISLILDDTFFLSLFHRRENSSISSIWVVTKSYLRGIDEGDRTIAHAWPYLLPVLFRLLFSRTFFPHTFFFVLFFSYFFPRTFFSTYVFSVLFPLFFFSYFFPYFFPCWN